VTTINGLPAHILLVHVVVILLPLTSGLAILGSIWPAAQRKFTFLTPIAALVALITVPITVSAGNYLMAHLATVTPAVVTHMHLADRIQPLAIALFLVAAGQWAYFQFAKPRRWATIAIAVVVIVVSLATTAQVALAGEAGSRAVWAGVVR
jgi:hypothetical protein